MQAKQYDLASDYFSAENLCHSTRRQLEWFYRRGYRVKRDGTLVNPQGVPIHGNKPKPGTYRRFTVNCVIDGRQLQLHLDAHRLQAYQKFGDALFEPRILCRHLDGNSLNNSWDNIAIGTFSDNAMDQPPEVRHRRACHAAAALIKYDAVAVHRYHQVSKSYRKTMAKFGISSKGTLHAVLKRGGISQTN
jgi:hypothetical protein